MNPGRAITAWRDGVVLEGELWMPSGRPRALLLMVPGSGPSDRHNDVFFPPIREHLVADRIAVASFDKRGVGGSSGAWQTAGIEEQAADAGAELDALVGEEELHGLPIGLFGHSQGGWVVIEAAARDQRVALVITSSGPGVSPANQERHAARTGLRRLGWSHADVERALAEHDTLFDMMRGGRTYEEFRRRIDSDPARRDRLAHLAQVAFVPDDAEVWDLGRRIIDYDPRPALERLSCPVLALFGAEDRSVPVEESVAVYRAATADVTTRIFAGADHRCQVGDPPAMAPGYLDELVGWLAARTRGARRPSTG